MSGDRTFDYDSAIWGAETVRPGEWTIAGYRLDEVLVHLPSRGRVLEMGCGAGRFLRAIHRQRPELELVGADVSRRALEILSETSPEIETRWMEDTALPAADGEFDAVLAMDVLEHLTDPVHTLTEIRRVLAPGGVFHLHVPCEADPRSLWRWLPGQRGERGLEAAPRGTHSVVPPQRDSSAPPLLRFRDPSRAQQSAPARQPGRRDTLHRTRVCRAAPRGGPAHHHGRRHRSEEPSHPGRGHPAVLGGQAARPRSILVDSRDRANARSNAAIAHGLATRPAVEKSRLRVCLHERSTGLYPGPPRLHRPHRPLLPTLLFEGWLARGDWSMNFDYYHWIRISFTEFDTVPFFSIPRRLTRRTSWPIRSRPSSDPWCGSCCSCRQTPTCGF